MKNSFILLLAFSLTYMLSSCNNDSIEIVADANGSTHKIDFLMKAETITVSPMSIGRQATNSSLTDAQINKYKYVILKKNTSNYYAIHGYEVTVNKPTEGSIDEKISTFLVDGDYRIAIYAYATINPGNIPGSDFVSSSGFSFNSTLKKNYLTAGSIMASDRYFASKDVKVAGGQIVPQEGDTELTARTLTLKRVVGRLDIVFSKGFPTGTKSININFSKNAYPYQYMFENMADGNIQPSITYNGTERSIYISDVSTLKEKEFVAGQGKHKYISVYLLGEDKPGTGASQYMTLTFTADNASYLTIAERTIEGTASNNFAMYRSMVTTLKGNLFGDPKEFEIDVENENFNTGPELEL